jgi:glucose/arabinose dehydrogenase
VTLNSLACRVGAPLLAAILLSACGTSAPAPGSTVQPPATAVLVLTATPGAARPGAQPAPSQLPTSISAPPARVSTFPDPAACSWGQVADGFALPDDIQFPDDGSDRMFVVEQPGRIRIVENGHLSKLPYLDITDRVGSAGNEQGLLGLAFHPDFKNHPYFYVNYTDRNGNTVIARFLAAGDHADPGSEKALMQIPQPYPNHNGGEMTFGPDGFLYLGLGDGGSQGDPNGNGQNTNVLLGKILRIDVDHGDPYGVPAGNPFADGGGRPEIWAYGLRNPWRFSFARTTRDLYIADVGQDLWEEVDVALGNPAGNNYGWNYFEGNHPYAGQPPGGLNFTMPVTEYSHADGGCAVIGGFVYTGQLSEWRGVYLYGDECSGNVWGLLNTSDPPSQSSWQSQLLFQTRASITSFGQDPAGEVYLADRAGGIYRLQK